MARAAARGGKAPAKPRAATPAPRKRASKSTVPSAETLAALSHERLIGLVLDEAGQNPAFKKRVSAAIAGLQGPDAVAAQVDRRLASLEKARGVIDWQKRKAFAADLSATVAVILGDLKPLDAGMALDRLVRFLGGAEGVLNRVDDSSGQVFRLYEDAAAQAAALGAALPEAGREPLAARLVPMLEQDGFGLIETLLAALLPDLPAAALARLDAGFMAALAALPEPAAESSRTSYAASERAWAIRAARRRLTTLRKAVADARGDVDAFVALEMADAPENPDETAIAERLLAAGRPEEALERIRRPSKRGRVVFMREIEDGLVLLDDPERERHAVEIRILQALGRHDAVQALRWSRFEAQLDAQALRDHLAALPDFEDEEALERAFAHVAARRDPHEALAFLIAWPDLARAARLVLDRRAEWSGRLWQWLAPAAEALETDHPLAASLLYRALLDDILGRARSAAYGHGARHLARLADLDGQLEPGGLAPDHAAYVADLRKAHGRKSGFWSLVEG